MNYSYRCLRIRSIQTPGGIICPTYNYGLSPANSAHQRTTPQLTSFKSNIPPMALRLLATWFAPTFTALSPYQHHCLSVRLRLLAFQPLLLLSYSITVFSNGFSGGYTVYLAPTHGRHILRYLVFLPPKWSADVRYPLHICFHSGGFIDGIPESTLPFC
jgi:hypothetical protein